MPKFDPTRPHEKRIPERIRTATSNLMILSSGSTASVGNQLRATVKGMPTQWTTGKALDNASMDGLAKAAINNLNKLVTESPHISAFSAADAAATRSELANLCGICHSFALTQVVTPTVASKLAAAIGAYRAHFCSGSSS